MAKNLATDPLLQSETPCQFETLAGPVFCAFFFLVSFSLSLFSA